MSEIVSGCIRSVIVAVMLVYNATFDDVTVGVDFILKLRRNNMRERAVNRRYSTVL